ncbi:hypothetical protein SE17_20900, partial [Kouleothrix aurantiaca]
MEIPQPQQPRASRFRRQQETHSMIIKANDVEKKFGDEAGVFDLNFEVPTGTIFGMIGPRGCCGWG